MTTARACGTHPNILQRFSSIIGPFSARGIAIIQWSSELISGTRSGECQVLSFNLLPSIVFNLDLKIALVNNEAGFLVAFKKVILLLVQIQIMKSLYIRK
jgi:hypothetical protein